MQAYVFPAIGHAAVLAQATAITDDVFLVAAETLATITSLQEVEQGRLFPPFSEILHISRHLVAAVANHMCQHGLGTKPPGCKDWLSYGASRFWSGTLPSKI